MVTKVKIKNSMKELFSKSATVIALIVLIIIFSILSNRFFRPDNLLVVLRQVSINGILALGITFVIICGGIDLSIGSTVALSAVVSVGCIKLLSTGSLGGSISIYGIITIAIIGTMLVGMFVGLFNGFLVSKVGMPSFIVTLSSMSIIRGLAYITSNGKTVQAPWSEFTFIGTGYIGPIPFPVIILIFITGVMYLVLHRTKFGVYIYAVGGNSDAAKYSGINIHFVQLVVFTICGILASLSGIISAARMYTAQPTIGNGYEMDAIAAAVLGGTSFSGGRGTILGTLVGALIIGVVNNGLDILNVAPYYQYVIKGAIILFAIYMDRFRE